MKALLATPTRMTLAPPATLSPLTERSVTQARRTFPLEMFHEAARRVPAYKDFLLRNRISPNRIRTANDLNAVPPTDKKNYISQYPLEQLCWDGSLSGRTLTYTATSGSTGTPFYFPRDAALDARSMLMHEMILRTFSGDARPTTLVIVSFGMGIWIGGTITYQAFRLLEGKGWPVSIITPGINKKEIFEALVKLGPKYEQVVLCGYPPFIKDVLDEAPEHGFDPAKRPLKLIFAAEAFSERFREYVMKKAGATDPLHDTANIYGSAELGTMAVETPVAISLRRQALKNSNLHDRLFSDASKLPTLAQFHPAIVNFETQDGALLLTGDNAIPLVRYAIGDRGGVHEFRSLVEISSALEAPIESVAPLPFVYVYERTDFSTSLYGIVIHAEYVRGGLQIKECEDSVTGKFSMSTERDAKENQFLDVQVELKPNVALSEVLRAKVGSAIVEALRKRSSEYYALFDSLRERVLPRVTLRPYGDPGHFESGTKQRWVKKTRNL
jgi:phenylacetate-CoA ligase